MKQEEIKFEYYIDSSLDLKEIIDCILKETNPEKGKLTYFSLEEDDLIEKEIPSKEIKEQVSKIYSEYDEITINLENVEINVGEDEINILSKIKLNLENIEIDETKEN